MKKTKVVNMTATMCIVISLCMVNMLNASEPAEQSEASSNHNQTKRILLIPTQLDHPWATHMYRQVCNVLARCLNNHPGVKAFVSPQDGWPEDPALLQDLDALVFYSRPAGDILLEAKYRKKSVRLLESGVGLTAIHWATGTGDDQYGPEYLELLGGWFSFAHSGLKVDKQTLQQVKPKHPICMGWNSYELRDEFYLNLKFSDNTQPLLKVNVDGIDQTVAWSLERQNSKGGRSFGTTLGHFHTNFAIEDFRRAILNGILWTAHYTIPSTGANASIPESELILPDPPPSQ